MTLTGIYGLGGSGKGVVSTIDCKFTPKEIPIYVNFDLHLKNAEKIEPEEVFEVFEIDRKIPVKKLVLDEAYGWFENRNSGSANINQFISYLMFQSRKLGLNWVSIAQLRGTLDLRWRGMENKVLNMHERNLDMRGYSTDDFVFDILKRTSIGVKVKRNIVLPYKKAIPFFSLYNTEQRILPQDFEDLKKKIEHKNPEKLDSYINSLVGKLLKFKKHFPVKILKDGTTKYKITQEWVRNALLEWLKEGSEYSSFVSVRLKNKLNTC